MKSSLKAILGTFRRAFSVAWAIVERHASMANASEMVMARMFPLAFTGDARHRAMCVAEASTKSYDRSVQDRIQSDPCLLITWEGTFCGIHFLMYTPSKRASSIVWATGLPSFPNDLQVAIAS